MYYSRTMRRRIRKAKTVLATLGLCIIMVLSILFIASLDNNRPYTYEECVKTYYGSHPDYIAKQCNYLK